MVSYYGDFAEDDTVDIPFNTFTSDDPSASSTITNFINTDVHIHKDGGVGQRNNAAGITVSVDFDGITGNHLVKIDTSDDTVAGFWVTGSEYQVRIEGTTVDGATVNSWIGAFSIERAGGVIALLKLIQAAVITNAAGADIAADIIAVKAETASILTDTGTTLENRLIAIEADTDVIDDGTSGLVKIASDVAAVLVDTAVIGALGAGLSAIPWNPAWDAEVQSEVADGLAAYDPPTNTEMASAFTEIKGATWAAGTDTLEQIRDKETDIETDTAEIGVNGAGLTDLATQASVDVIDGIVDAILVDTAVIGALGAGLTGIPWNASWDAEVQSEVADALAAYPVATKAEMDSGHALLATPAQVNAQVVDALNVDTYAEPGQEAPAATNTLVKKIGYLFKEWRNKTETSSSEHKLFNDDAATVDQKRALSDDGTDFTKGEYGSGP